jgi:hypothetical protein
VARGANLEVAEEMGRRALHHALDAKQGETALFQ